MKSPIRYLPLTLTIALVLSACAGGDDAGPAIAYDRDAPQTTEAPATTSAASVGEEPGSAGDGADAEEGTSTDAVATPASVDPADYGRKIVYTATITVEVDDVVTAGEEAVAAVAGLGGILFGQQTTTGDHPRSVLTIKVPPENFQAALERLGGVGELVSQSIFADDVTERVVDLQSRITTSQASVERLRAFLEDATDLEAVAALEQELLDRETELEILRGQLRTLEDLVSLATITLTLTEPVPPIPDPALELIQTGYTGHDDGDGCPGAEELRVDEAERITICFEIVNTGDTDLADIEVRDPGLDADEDDLIVVLGDPAAPLPPEGRIIFAYEMDAAPELDRTDPRVQATAVDRDGEPTRIEVAFEVERLDLRVDPDDSLPGFGDALSAAWTGLQKLWGVVVLAAGIAVPFLWVPVLILAALWLLRRRSSETPEAPPAEDRADAEDHSREGEPA